MTEAMLEDLDPILAERIRRIAAARGWGIRETLVRLLEHGLFIVESEVRGGFDDHEVDVLSEAIAALKQVPEGQGF